MFIGEFRNYMQSILLGLRAIQQQGTQIMTQQEIITKAMGDLKAAVAAGIAKHATDAQTIADLTSKLVAGTTGGDNTVDVVALAGQINDAVQQLNTDLQSSSSSAVSPQPTIANTSNISGGGSTSGDVLSASSIQVQAGQSTGGVAAPKDPNTPPPVVPTGTATQTAPVSTDPVATVMSTVNGTNTDQVQAAVDAHADATDNGAAPHEAVQAANDAAQEAGADPMTAAAIAAAIPSKSN